MAPFCLTTTFAHQTERNTQFLGSQNPPDAWYHWLWTTKENNYCLFLIFRITISKTASPARKLNQHTSADDMKSFDPSARRMIFKYSSFQQFPSFPYPHKRLMFSSLACQQYLFCIWKTPKKPGATSKEPNYGLDLLLHWQGCKERWLTPQSCRITSLTASEHDTPLQKLERQQVSVSVTTMVLRIKGISFSLRVTEFH